MSGAHAGTSLLVMGMQRFLQLITHPGLKDWYDITRSFVPLLPSCLSLIFIRKERSDRLGLPPPQRLQSSHPLGR